MATSEHDIRSEGRYVHANGTDIHYVEAGQGEPLLLLHGGLVSTYPLWAGIPFAYVSHMDTLAEHFRVIAPDTRGFGKTVNPGGGPVAYTLLADDVVGLIDALGLDRPLVCGFSAGGHTATIVGIRHPGSVRAIANHAGYDLFNPQAFSHTMTRHLRSPFTWRLALFGLRPPMPAARGGSTEVCVSYPKSECPPRGSRWRTSREGGQGHHGGVDRHRSPQGDQRRGCRGRGREAHRARHLHNQPSWFALACEVEQAIRETPLGCGTKAHFASYTDTAPVEVSSGGIVRHRLSRGGDRQLNHALHMIAICQITHDTEGRAYYRRMVRKEDQEA